MSERAQDGWELNREGKASVAQILGAPPAPPEAATLRSALDKVPNAESRAFAEEAVRCFEARLYRAAVVLRFVSLRLCDSETRGG